MPLLDTDLVKQFTASLPFYFCAKALHGKKILIGVTSSISAFKVYELIRLLKACGAAVRVVATKNATHFISVTTIETLTEHAVLTNFYSTAQPASTHHIETARWADFFFVYPCSANTLAKLANGICDDLLTTEFLAHEGVKFVAPAMNPVMFQAPPTQNNLNTLKRYGVKIIGPEEGIMACKESGLGRLSDPLTIVLEASKQILSSGISGTVRPSVLLTLGPTQTMIDPVRLVTNRSSGLMGAGLAWAAYFLDLPLELVSGPTDVVLPPVANHAIKTADNYFNIVKKIYYNFNIYISTAAVLDWEITNPRSQKTKKPHTAQATSHAQPFDELEFTVTPDVLQFVAQNQNSKQVTIGFAAETENELVYAQQKLNTKNCDAIFVNTVSSPQRPDPSSTGFETPTNGGTLLIKKTNDQNTVITFETQPKPALAWHLLQHILKIWSKKQNA